MTHAAIRKWGVRFLLLCAFVIFSISWIVGSKLTAPAHCGVPIPQAAFSSLSSIEKLQLETKSGGVCAAWYSSRPNATATVILAHPIRANRRAMLSRAAFLLQQGYSVVLIDLPAHGESDGDRMTFGFRERLGVVAAVDFVREKTPDHKVAVIGWSLGGASALYASPLPIDALVLESVYSSINLATRNRLSRRLGRMASLASPLLLAQLPLRLGVWPSELRPIDLVGAVECPVLMLAGEKDEHTTLAETKAMFDAAREPKQLVRFPQAAHVDLHTHDRGRYEEQVGSFLREHLKTMGVEQAEQ